MGKARLTDAQVRWLNDPRPYFHEYTDRTGRALINKGVIRVTERDLGGTKCGYELTDTGRALLASDAGKAGCCHGCQHPHPAKAK